MEINELNSKDQIKARVLRNAAYFWGVKDVNRLDPVVKMMIEAMASELFRISNEVNNIETRILEKMARTLTPDAMINSHPAHAVMYYEPDADETELDKYTQFIIDSKNIHTHKHTKTIFHFSPVDNVPLFSAKIKGLIAGRNCFTIHPATLEKEIVARANSDHPSFHHSIWIGLDIKAENWKDLYFFFDFPHTDNKDYYFDLLPYTKWSFNTDELSIISGLPYRSQNNNANSLLASDLSEAGEKAIKHNYHSRYIHINRNYQPKQEGKCIFPEELKELFSKQAVSAFSNSLYWIKVDFPANFPVQQLEDIIPYINAVPIVNRRIEKTGRAILQHSGIIAMPVRKSEFFHSISCVSDEKDRRYYSLPYGNTEEQAYGSYVVKRGGTERFNRKDAREFIMQLVDLMRDESTAFAAFNTEDIQQQSKELFKNIDKLSNQLSLTERSEINSYVIVSPLENAGMINIEYWVINGEQANGIRPGTPLSFLSDKKSKTIFLLSPTKDGAHLSRSSDLLDGYKYALTSGEKIYTVDDIINFCRWELADKLGGIEVKRGWEISPKPKEGFVRTLDVFIYPSTAHTDFYKTNGAELCTNLRSKLTAQSPPLYNYRVFIKE